MGAALRIFVGCISVSVIKHLAKSNLGEKADSAYNFRVLSISAGMPRQEVTAGSSITWLAENRENEGMLGVLLTSSTLTV